MKHRIHTVKNDEEKLRMKSQEVQIIDNEIKDIVKELFKAVESTEHVGVGLAAPQIGIHKRIIVIGYSGDVNETGEIVDKLPKMALINPKIIKSSREKIEMDEGCFSVPLVYGPVVRPKKVKVEALDINGRKVCLNASGYLARVLQHEIDHLDGIIFTDLISDFSRVVKYKKLPNGYYEIEM